MPLNKKNIKVLILICGIIGFFSYELDELYCADHKYSRQSKYFQLDSLNLNVKVEMLKMPKVKIFFSRDDKFSNDYIITSCNDYEGPVIYIRNDTIMFRDPDNTGKISTEKFTIIRFDDELKLTPKRNAYIAILAEAKSHSDYRIVFDGNMNGMYVRNSKDSIVAEQHNHMGKRHEIKVDSFSRSIFSISRDYLP